VPSWRREESENNFAGEDGVGPVRDWRDSAEAERVGRKSAREVWEQAEEKGGFAKATDVPSALASFTSELGALEAETTGARNQVASEVAEPEAAPQAAALSEETAVADVAPRPEITAMSLPVGAADVQFVSESRTAEVAAETAAVEEPAFAQEAPAPLEVGSARSDLKSAANSWFSSPSSPWDTDAQQGHKLAASWDGGSVAAESGAAATAADVAPEKHGNGESSHEEVTAVLADEPAAIVAAPEVPVTEPPAAAEGPGSEAEMDALIARVMAKLNPEVLNAVAQQILKPAVAAILADELKSKK
jgi:hypothetical protein